MNAQPNRLTRRTFLTGVGVTMGLPWLEALAASGTSSAAHPQRFAALFMGNGISPKNWWAEGAGPRMKLSKSLEPLSPHRSRLNVVSGLFNRHEASGFPLREIDVDVYRSADGRTVAGGMQADRGLCDSAGQ